MGTSRLPQVTGAKVVRVLERKGWYVKRVHGSHYIMAHAEKRGARVVVPVHPKPLRKGTLADIIEQAGLTVEEFLDLL